MPRAPRPPRRSSGRIRARSLTWIVPGAFACGSTLAALAGLLVERGALEMAAFASMFAGAMTLAAGLSGERLGEVSHRHRQGRG